MNKSTYIVAVSGGVDSVVLLDMLATHNLETAIFGFDPSFIVAHFDHGIRTESADDAQFVATLAKKYGLPFEHDRAGLGTGASESLARDARYKFLRQCCKKYNAAGIVTAHHRDDVIETAVINVLRGTAWRGLASLTSHSLQNDLSIIRPLLHKTKKELLSYAKNNNLQWVEDATNQDQRYLRNNLRISVLPKLQRADPEFIEKLSSYIQCTQELKIAINEQLESLLKQCVESGSIDSAEVSRYSMIMWPDVVSKEVIYAILRKLDKQWHPSSLHITKALLFCKTAHIGKELHISGRLRLHSYKRLVQFKKI